MKALENLLMALVGLIARVIFITYRAIALLAAAGAAVYFIIVSWLYKSPELHEYWWYPLPVLALGLLPAVARPRRSKDNPTRRYPGLTGPIDACADAFIAWIGTLKYFTSPLSLVEDPGSYKIKGAEIRDLIDGGLQPGDILLRGYDGYLDGIMIGLTGGGKGLGKYFSHAALYLGELNDEGDKQIAARRLQTQEDSGAWVPAREADKDKIRNNPDYYQAGRQMVVHAMTRGVFVEDILTFLRCDYLAVLRLHDRFQLGPQERGRDRSLIKSLSGGTEEIHASLMKGENVSRTDVIKQARNSALGKIGSCYDFQFNDLKTANRFSCSEFVYYCFKSIHSYLGLVPKPHAFLNVFFRRSTITPADIYEAAVSRGKLEITWTSGSLKKR
jgi:hypothetical protein